MSYFLRNIRLLILVLGFGSGLAGTVGSFFFIDTLNDDIEDLTNQRNAAAQEIDKLGRLAADYFIANQQGDLIYALGLQEGARTDVLALIYQGNLLDRAEPVRNLIGAMAVSGLLGYSETYGEYERLNDAARQSLSFEAYTKVKTFERDVVERAQKRVGELQVGLVPLQEDVSEAEARLRSRNQGMILFASAGAFLLLLANLVEHRRAERLSQAAVPGARPAVDG